MAGYDIAQRLELFPTTTRIEGGPGNGRLHIAGCDLDELAERYGTPLYLYDQATMDEALQTYRRVLAETYPASAGLTHAGKAFLCIALAQWAGQHGLWLDCTGRGELEIARAAGLLREQIVVHGVNKSPADLEAALALAGTLVVDNRAELERFIALAEGAASPLPGLWLRLRPGVAVATHAHNQTGQEDSKFGMSAAEAQAAVRICQQKGLAVTGLHFHLGSQFRDPSPLGPALERMLDLVADLHSESGWFPQAVCPGGGWGVAYHEDDLPHPPVEAYVRFVAGHLVQGCRQRGLPLPRLQLEPGRSLVARAGVALYRLGSVKQTAQRRWLLLDGGLADNPRPALYSARYSALPVHQPGRPGAGPAWLAGPFCESGDVLVEALPLPTLQPGELVAVPMSGAYQLSMASNYNGACRPAVLWLTKHSAHLIQRREEPTELIRRDVALPLVNR